MKKIYGQSKMDFCPLCGKRATTTNNQKIPMCHKHKDQELNDLKCACGEYLDVKFGKYGPFCVCMHCGNINLNKALALNNYPLKSIDEL